MQSRSHEAERITIEEALTDRHRWLQHQAGGDLSVRRKAIHDLEDAGSTEARIRQDYTGRYPVELLQNAHDACADAKHHGVVRFTLTESALLVANEGVPFTAERILSLVRHGASEKAAGRAHRHNIGYKGVGFTAVFEISDQPQIISDGVAFGFDAERAREEVSRALEVTPRQVASRYFPFRLTSADWEADAGAVDALLGSGAVTVIRLPLRAGTPADEIAKHLRDTLPPEVLLFMPYVREFHLTIGGTTSAWRRRSGRKIGIGTLATLAGDDESTRSWLMATDQVIAPRDKIAELNDPLWADSEQLNVAVAFPWKRGRGIDEDAPTQRFHVYFPTDDSTGRSILVHGDFYVDASRRHIATRGAGGAISRLVGAAAAKLTARLAESVATEGKHVLSCLAAREKLSGFGDDFGKMLERSLADSKIVHTLGTSVPSAPSGLRRLKGELGTEEARKLGFLLDPRADLVDPGVASAAEVISLLDRLGVRPLEDREITQRVDLSTADVDPEAGLRTLSQWVDSIPSWRVAGVRSALRERRVVQDTRGKWRTASEVVLSKAVVPRLPRKLRRTQLRLPKSKAARDFIHHLNIQELTPVAALEVVLSGIETERLNLSREADCRDAFTFVSKLWSKHRRVIEAQKRRLGKLPVPAEPRGKGIPNRSQIWKPAEAVYFTSEWTGDPLLESLYGQFGEAEFLAEVAPANEALRDARFEFFEALGVAAAPRQRRISSRSEWRLGQELLRFSRWRNLPDVRAAFECPDGHPRTDREVQLEVLDRLDQIVGGRSAGRTQLGKALAGQKSPFGPAASVRCTSGSHGGKGRRQATGYQRWLLSATPWIHVKNDPEGSELRPPQEVWVGVPRAKSWLLVPQTQYSEKIGSRLEMVSAEAPKAASVELALQRLAAAYPDLESAPEEALKTARWLLRHLDRATRKLEPGRSCPPLLALSCAGTWSWACNPVVPDLTGLEHLPSVQRLPEGEWSGLRRVYSLPLASEVVAVDIQRGRRLQDAPTLPLELRAELAALLSRSSSESKIPSRLARLREIRLAGLELELHHGGDIFRTVVSAYLLRKRDSQLRTIGGELLLTPESSYLQIGKVLADYLDEPGLAAEITLFLTQPGEMLCSRSVTEEEVEEAAERMSRVSRPSEPESVEAAGVQSPDGAHGAENASEVGTATEPSAGENPGRGHSVNGGIAPVPAGLHREKPDPGPVAAKPTEEEPPKRPLISTGVQFGAPRPGTPQPSRRAGKREHRRVRTSLRRVTRVRRPSPEAERAAVDIVVRYGSEVLGVQVEDVQTENRGWDLEFHYPDGRWDAVEVKGSTGATPYIITRNELRAATRMDNYVLYFVMNLGNSSKARMLRFREIGKHRDKADLTAYAYEVRGWTEIPHEVIGLTERTQG